MSARILNFPPGALRPEQAARYCGVCPATFRDKVAQGVLPRHRSLGGIKLWLRADLDEALERLPTDDEDAAGNTCDEVFK